jgi:hypothetical protein
VHAVALASHGERDVPPGSGRKGAFDGLRIGDRHDRALRTPGEELAEHLGAVAGGAAADVVRGVDKDDGSFRGGDRLADRFADGQVPDLPRRLNSGA